MSKLTSKVAVITGASKGIGAAIAKSLAAEGASVVVNYASSMAGAESVVAAIIKAGGKAVAVGGDITKAAEAQAIIDAAIKAYGRLDILVNNAGFYEFAALEAITEESFHKLFDINVLGLLLVTQAAAKQGTCRFIQPCWQMREVTRLPSAMSSGFTSVNPPCLPSHLRLRQALTPYRSTPAMICNSPFPPMPA